MPPTEYPEVGVYHPRFPGRIAETLDQLPAHGGRPKATVGLLVMRSYVLASNAGHYDGMIAALEARGLRVVPVFATGLDARPAIEKIFPRRRAPDHRRHGVADGFQPRRRPRLQRRQGGGEILSRLDVPYVAAHPVEFQTLEQWQESERGLLPVESTIMVAIPELDGSTGPAVFGGRAEGGTTCAGCARQCHFPRSESLRDMHVCAERAEALAARVEKLALLRRSERAERKVAIVLFNFPPNAGNTGTAAYLSVFESLLPGARRDAGGRLLRRRRPRMSTRSETASSMAIPLASARSPMSMRACRPTTTFVANVG